MKTRFTEGIKFYNNLLSLQKKLTMEQSQAIEILLQVAQMAQKGGLLSLQDATIVAKAVEILTPKKEEIE